MRTVYLKIGGSLLLGGNIEWVFLEPNLSTIFVVVVVSEPEDLHLHSWDAQLIQSADNDRAATGNQAVFWVLGT